MPKSKPARTNTEEGLDEEALQKQQIRRGRFRRELVGMALGIGVALMLGSLVPAISQQYSLGIVVLWGGAIGGIIASYERFEQAGAALTRRENRVLNFAIGAGIPLLILLAVFMLGRR